MFIPDPDLDFYPSRIPDPGVKKAPDPGSATLEAKHWWGSDMTLNTGSLSNLDLKFCSSRDSDHTKGWLLSVSPPSLLQENVQMTIQMAAMQRTTIFRSIGELWCTGPCSGEWTPASLQPRRLSSSEKSGGTEERKLGFLSVLRIRIRDPGSGAFWPRDPGSGIGFFRIPDPKTILLRVFWQFFW